MGQSGLRLYKFYCQRQFAHSFSGQTDRSDSNSVKTTESDPSDQPQVAVDNTKATGLSQSLKFSNQTSSDYDGAKLRQIIETSNMSASRQIERQRQKQLELGLEEKRNEPVKLGHAGTENPKLGYSGSVDGVQYGPKPGSAFDLADKLKNTTKTLANDLNATASDTKVDHREHIDTEHTSKAKGTEDDIYDEEQWHNDRCTTSDTFLTELTQKLNHQRALFNAWANEKWDHTQNSLQNVGQSLYKATGYSDIEKHKRLVEQVEHEIQQVRSAVKAAKAQYEQAIRSRSDLQKEINELLTRKHTWTPEDVERFTELYKNDHQNQHNEVSSKQRLDEAEQHVEAVQMKLTALILSRYHEEQLWSDKIRQALTWGTWMLMGVNIALFATATFFVEPWKRRKLVTAFQTEVQQKMDEYSLELKSLSQRLPSNALISQNTDLETSIALGKSLAPKDSHHISFFGIKSWNSLQNWVSGLVAAVQSPGNMHFMMGKPDFAVLSGILMAFGWLFGSLVNFVVFSR